MDFASTGRVLASLSLRHYTSARRIVADFCLVKLLFSRGYIRGMRSISGLPTGRSCAVAVVVLFDETRVGDENIFYHQELCVYIHI